MDGPYGPFVAGADAFDLLWPEGEYPVMFKPRTERGEDFERRMVENDPYAVFVHISEAAPDHPNAFARTEPHLLQEFKENTYSLARADRAMREVIFGIGF